jgi:hypothetical protein
LHHHAVEHWHREERIGSAENHRSGRSFRFSVSISLNKAKRLFLIWPDHEPDIDPHDQTQPHPNPNQAETRLQRQRLAEIMVMTRYDNTHYNRRKCGPAEPEERNGRDIFGNAGLQFSRNGWHRRYLDEIKIV